LSIYFRDPNGVRLEITTPLDKEWNQHTKSAKADLDLWVESKERAKREGKDVPQAMVELARKVRKRYEQENA
ncbi:MAG: hypothetical protein AB7K04_16705, partial [Pseudorhodoplanes sp.]